VSVKAIADSVELSLRRYVKEPSVVVEVAEYHSRPIYLMGQFRTPGVYYMDRPMTFLQGITLGTGSIPPPTCAACASFGTRRSPRWTSTP